MAGCWYSGEIKKDTIDEDWFFGVRNRKAGQELLKAREKTRRSHQKSERVLEGSAGENCLGTRDEQPPCLQLTQGGVQKYADLLASTEPRREDRKKEEKNVPPAIVLLSLSKGRYIWEKVGLDDGEI